MRQKPPLSNEQITAANKLATDNIRLAHAWCRRNGAKGIALELDEDDLLRLAMNGMVRASRTFDPIRGKFSTYLWLVLNSELRRIYINRKRRRAKAIIFNFSQNEDGVPIDMPARTENIEIEDQEQNAHIAKLMKHLDAREKQVIRERFWDKKKLHQIAAALGITKERVRQIEFTAIRKMRHPG